MAISGGRHEILSRIVDDGLSYAVFWSLTPGLLQNHASTTEIPAGNTFIRRGAKYSKASIGPVV